MAQAVSYGSITIIDTNDIEEIYMIYAGSNSSDSMPTFTYAAVTGGTIWKRDASQVTGNYIWQSTVVTKSGVDITSSNWTSFYGVPVCITGPEGADARKIISVVPYYYLSTSNTGQTGGSWNTIPPTYPSTGTSYYWTKTVTTYDSGSPTESTPVLDMALTNAAKDSRDANSAASQALSISIDAQGNSQGALSIARATEQHYWFNPKTEGTLEAGAYITDTPIDTFKNGKAGGYLLTRSDGLELGKGTNKFMTLSGSELDFYRPGTTTIDAKLSSTGLNITNGSIILGGHGATGVNNGDIALSNSDFTRSINGTSRANLRFAIGKNFGVKNDGTVYASNADISGKINATSGKIGGLILEQNSIHSNEKNLNNDIAGLYMDSSGQFNVGTRNRYVKFWNEDISIESGTISLANITLNKETFLNKINHQSNTYSFIYYNSKWKLNSNEVLLADYGISINGVTLKNNDAIRITYQPNNWKIDIQANTLSFSSGMNVEDELITTQAISKIFSGYDKVTYEINGTSNIKEIDIDEEIFISKVKDYGTYNFTYKNGKWVLFIINKDSNTIPEENITLNRDTFLEKVGFESKNYLFTYTNQIWTLNGSAIDLKEYGLDVKPVNEGDLSEGENFTLSCANGNINFSQYGVTYNTEQLPVDNDVIKIIYVQIDGLEGQITGIQENTQLAINNASKAESAADNAIEIASELSGETIGSENILVKTTGIPLNKISLDKTIFLDKIEKEQNVYNFIFSNGNWNLTKKEGTSTTSTQNDLVVLEQYGITISSDYTPKKNDSIEITYEGFVPFSQLNNNISNLDDKLNQAILDSVERSTTKSDELTNSIEQLRNDFENEKQEREARITFGLDGGFPIMTLAGGKVNPDLSITITNSELDFLDKGNRVAFISGQLLNINNAKILSNLQFGDFAFIPRENGNFCLKYLGTEDV